MQASNQPTKIQIPFANSGTKNSIPVASQIGVTLGAASLTDGFPPLTMTPIAAGGVPPAGADFNGILNMITAIQQWQCAGGAFKYDSAFSTANGGYPKGALLTNATNDGYWLNMADANTTNPDATDGTAVNWIAVDTYGTTAITGLTNANVTLTPPQYAKPVITLAGTLTGNVQIIMPTTTRSWYVVNNTTGNYTVTAKTASGTGAAIPQGGYMHVWGDGTNINQTSQYVVTPAPLDSSTKAAPTAFANMVGAVVGTMRNAKMTIAAPSASATFTADELVVETALGGAPLRLANFNKTINLATTGAGGMDTGTAPVSGFVALYAIYNPATQTAAELAVDATSAAAPSIYGGANMPAGYTASALISVWPTNASSQFVIGNQADRKISTANTQVLSTSTQQASLTSLSIAGAVPKNAKAISGFMGLSSSSVGSGSISVASSTVVGQQVFAPSIGQISTGYNAPFNGLQLITQQTLYYTATVNAGTMTAAMFINQYEF